MFIFVQNFLEKGFVHFSKIFLVKYKTLFSNFSCFRYANGLITSLLSALTPLKIDFSVYLSLIERKFSVRGA